ncbi:MAG TPA: hypothetical protein VFF03_08495 [Rhodocyclaceae bacterium]|nr:hypothetical protein [Rhodocyclaceae bacterium]
MVVSWHATFSSWRYGIVLLLCYLPFAGAVALWLHPSPLPALFKDFFFVIPAYCAFWLSQKNAVRVAYVPKSIWVAMVALAFMVAIQSFNPGLASWLVAAIGAKVWLFYLPLVFLAFEMIESRDDLIGVLRLLVVIAWIPCTIGILEWLACKAFGYVETMSAIYGLAAEGATQNFASFEIGGEFFRIPSTFSFSTQYFGFTLSMLVPAYVLTKLDESIGWRVFSAATFCLAMLAAFMSGARASYVFVPLLLVLVFGLEGKFKGSLKVAVVVTMAMSLALYVGGIDMFALYELVQELFFKYADEIARQGLADAIQMSPLGVGTGMNTGPARYGVDDPENFIGIENYYAKAVVELGIPGLLVVVGLFFLIAKEGYRVHSQLRDSGLRSCASAFLAFVVMMALNSFKGWQLDLDPVNVYFWMFVGFLLKLEYLDLQDSELEDDAVGESYAGTAGSA